MESWRLETIADSLVRIQHPRHVLVWVHPPGRSCPHTERYRRSGPWESAICQPGVQPHLHATKVSPVTAQVRTSPVWLHSQQQHQVLGP